MLNCIVRGTLQALQFYGLDHENKWAQLGYEATFFALFFFLAWCAGDLLFLQCVKILSFWKGHPAESLCCPAVALCIHIEAYSVFPHKHSWCACRLALAYKKVQNR